MNQLVWPLVVTIAGALVYAFAGNAKAAELGRIAFFCGLLWLVYATSGRMLRL